MAAVRSRGVSQVAKETRWKRRRDTAATTQCGLAPVCEILITLNNLLIYPHTHTISNWPKNTVADFYTDWHAAKVVVVGVNYKKGNRIRSLKRTIRPRVSLWCWS